MVWDLLVWMNADLLGLGNCLGGSSLSSIFLRLPMPCSCRKQSPEAGSEAPMLFRLARELTVLYTLTTSGWVTCMFCLGGFARKGEVFPRLTVAPFAFGMCPFSSLVCVLVEVKSLCPLCLLASAVGYYFVPLPQ